MSTAAFRTGRHVVASTTNARSLESLLERGVVLGRDVLVGSRLQREDRRLQFGRSLGRLGWAAVEAHGAGQSVLVGGGEPRLASTETEADAEDPLRAVFAEIGDAGGDVGLHRRRRRLVYMRPVFELLVALRRTRGPAEVVECDRGDAALGEAQGELLVEAVEATDVREDHDADLRRLVGRRRKGGEGVAVGRLQSQILVRDGRAADDRNRRRGVEVEAHAWSLRCEGVPRRATRSTGGTSRGDRLLGYTAWVVRARVTRVADDRRRPHLPSRPPYPGAGHGHAGVRRARGDRRHRERRCNSDARRRSHLAAVPASSGCRFRDAAGRPRLRHRTLRARTPLLRHTRRRRILGAATQPVLAPTLVLGRGRSRHAWRRLGDRRRATRHRPTAQSSLQYERRRPNVAAPRPRGTLY